MTNSKSLEKEKQPVGRPPMYKTAEELEDKIDEYFESGYETRKVMVKQGKDDYTEKDTKLITISGLVLFLGFCDRASFYDYGKNPKFSHTIKKARSFIERHYEGIIQSGNPAGAIFALKNFGWKDKTEIEQTVTVTEMPTIKLDTGEDLVFDVGDDPDE